MKGLESNNIDTELLVLLARGLCKWSRGAATALAGLTFLVFLPLLLDDSIFMMWAQAHMQEKSHAAAEVQRPHSSGGHTEQQRQARIEPRA